MFLHSKFDDTTATWSPQRGFFWQCQLAPNSSPSQSMLHESIHQKGYPKPHWLVAFRSPHVTSPDRIISVFWTPPRESSAVRSRVSDRLQSVHPMGPSHLGLEPPRGTEGAVSSFGSVSDLSDFAWISVFLRALRAGSSPWFGGPDPISCTL